MYVYVQLKLISYKDSLREVTFKHFIEITKFINNIS